MAFQRFPAFPPTLILQGDADSGALASRSGDLDALVAKRQNAHELHLYERVEHGFNFPESSGYDPAASKDA